MEMNTMENGKMDKNTGMEFGKIRKVIVTSDSGSKIVRTVMEFTSGKMETGTKESGIGH